MCLDCLRTIYSPTFDSNDFVGGRGTQQLLWMDVQLHQFIIWTCATRVVMNRVRSTACSLGNTVQDYMEGQSAEPCGTTQSEPKGTVIVRPFNKQTWIL